MEFVGRSVTKNVGGRAWSGSVESYSPATGLFTVVYDDGVYEEMGLPEVSPLLIPLPPPPAFDLNICEIDLTDDGEEAAGSGGLHGLDLNEGFNHILHEEDVDSNPNPNPNPKRKMLDLNLEAANEEEEPSSAKRARLFNLNVELKEDKQAVAAEDRPLMPPPAAARWRPTEESTSSSISSYVEDLRRQILMARRHNFSLEQYALLATQFFNQFRIPGVAPPPALSAPPPAAPLVLLPPKVELPPCSANFDLKGASLMDFLSVYSFLRSFSVSLFISPFQIHDFASSVMSNDSTSLFDAIHLSLLTTLRRHLKSLSDAGSLNWDLLDSITWPVFLYEYLTFHSPKHIPGLAELSKEDAFVPFQSDYYAMPASAKIAILQHLCDEVVETEACRSEVNRRVAMTESNNWRSRYFSCKVVKKAGDDGMVEEYTNDFVDDGNGDECYLCRGAGVLTCCDGCPAAFHAKCVGIAAAGSLSSEGEEWFCPECTFDKANPKPFHLTKSVRGLESVGVDPHGRIYYTCCEYLLVSDSCNGEYSFLLYKGDDEAAVLAALESCSSSHYDKITSAVRKHWNSVNHLSCSGQETFPESSSTPAATIDVEVPTLGTVVSVPGEIAASDEIKTISPGTNTTVPDVGTSASVAGDGSQAPVIITTGQGDDDQMTANDGGSGTVAQEPCEPCYINLYEFGRTTSLCSKELASELSTEDATRSAKQVMALQMRIISNRYASCSWSNVQNLNLQSRNDKCGWCCGCQAPEESKIGCLFIMIDSINQAAASNFTSHTLGIQAGVKTKKHLIDVICHVIWMEDRLHGLLSGPWLTPNYSKTWRRFGLEATHIGYLKKMLLQLELNLHRRALSGDWTKNADAADTMGSASHIVRRSTRVLPVAGSSSGKRKCPNQGVTRTPKDAVGVNLSWWRGGRTSRELFNWKVVPRASASIAARQGGCSKIAGVHYPASGEFAKRMKFTAWRAAVETAKTVEQLALLVRVLEENIKWNDIGNVRLLPEKESKKPVKSFKNVVIREERREGEKVQYLLDFGKNKLIPNIVVKHGSLIDNCSSQQKKYWLEESHVPLHLLKAFQEKRLLRESNSAPAELHESSQRVELPQRKKGFEYLFERAGLQQ